LLAAPAEARRVVYLVDCSISMGPSGALAAARKEVAASLRRLPINALFQVIPYNRLAEPLEVDGRRGLVAAVPACVEEAVHLLDDIQPEGATDHAKALRRGLLLRPDVLFLVTDADGLAPAEAASLLRLNQGRAALHVVELSHGGPDQPDGPLARLARGAGGSYRRVDVEER
jgi:hypothetical protein